MQLTIQVAPAASLRDFYAAGSGPYMWINYSHYPPRTPEMLLLNLLAIAMATFLIETLQENSGGQVSIIIVAIFNKFQPLTQQIISLEMNDTSSCLIPTWMKSPTMLLEGRTRSQFLFTLETVLSKFLDIPTFTSPFANAKITVAYYTLINDLKNACHILSPNAEARFVVPTDTKARRDLSKYLTTLPVNKLELKLHRGVSASKEMMVCNVTGGSKEGRRAMRSFGMVAASFVRENPVAEENASTDLIVWLALSATGAWQEVKFEWMPAYAATGAGQQVLRSAARFTSAKTLRAWAHKCGHAEALNMIRLKLKRPRQSLESAARMAVGLPPKTSLNSWPTVTLPSFSACHFQGNPSFGQWQGQATLTAVAATTTPLPTLPAIRGFSSAALPADVPGPSHVTPPPRPRHACSVPSHRNTGIQLQIPHAPPTAPLATIHHDDPQSESEAAFRPLMHLELLADTATILSRGEPQKFVAGHDRGPPLAHGAPPTDPTREETPDQPLNLVMRKSRVSECGTEQLEPPARSPTPE